VSNQAAFTTVSYSDLLAYAVGAERDDILWGPVVAGGTHVWLRKGRIWKAYLINDLTSGAITITGQPIDVTLNNTKTPWASATGGAVGSWPVTKKSIPLTTDIGLVVLLSPLSGTITASIAAGTKQSNLVGLGSDIASLQSGGSAAAPGAGTNISGSVTLVSTQWYNIWVFATIALGTIVAGDEANMVLNSGVAGNLMTLPYTTDFGGPFGPFRYQGGVADTLQVLTVGGSGIGVNYIAGLIALPVP